MCGEQQQRLEWMDTVTSQSTKGVRFYSPPLLPPLWARLAPVQLESAHFALDPRGQNLFLVTNWSLVSCCNHEEVLGWVGF